jgi:hypothetical protein
MLRLSIFPTTCKPTTSKVESSETASEPGAIQYHVGQTILNVHEQAKQSLRRRERQLTLTKIQQQKDKRYHLKRRSCEGVNFECGLHYDVTFIGLQSEAKKQIHE